MTQRFYLPPSSITLERLYHLEGTHRRKSLRPRVEYATGSGDHGLFERVLFYTPADEENGGSLLLRSTTVPHLPRQRFQSPGSEQHRHRTLGCPPETGKLFSGLKSAEDRRAQGVLLLLGAQRGVAGITFLARQTEPRAHRTVATSTYGEGDAILTLKGAAKLLRFLGH